MHRKFEIKNESSVISVVDFLAVFSNIENKRKEKDFTVSKTKISTSVVVVA